jgi:nucleoside-diphosphate-sugar epimerase
VGDVLKRVVPVPLSSDAVDRLLGSLCLDITRLKTLTGYAPVFSPSEGLAAVARSLRP